MFEWKRLLGSISIFLVTILSAGLMVVKIFKEHERGSRVSLGRLVAFRGSGLSFVIPLNKLPRSKLTGYHQASGQNGDQKNAN